jgi:hypothetical protein
MVRSIKLSPKYALVSTCLLLVLVAGVMAQTAAQSTNTSLDLAVFGLTGPLGECDYGYCPVYFQAVVNGKPYCIFGLQTGFYPPDPIFVLLNEGYEGECQDEGYDYVGAGGGGLVTSGYHPSSGFVVAGTITIDLQGQVPPYAFTLVVDLTAGGINIQSKVTGNLNIQPGACTLSNLVSQYASATGTGLNLNLQLLAETGSCQGRLHLVLTFGNAAAAVGGVVIPVSTFAVLAPWLALIGLAGCIGIAALIAKGRRQ